MESDADENYEDSYTEEDARRHDNLVNKVLSLNKTQHIKKPSRTEPTLQISEFDLVKSITGGKGSIKINELTKSLRNRKSRLTISENVKRSQKNSHTLPKPLEKPQANRIRRSVAYEKTRLQLDRWEATVTSNRVSTNLSFPLNDDVKMDKKETENFASMWRVKSKLAEELGKHEPIVEEFHIILEQEKFPLTMNEMLSRRREAAKLRAYQGYKEARARRQNNIKSKKYHRIQKREKIKKKLKEFEQLQKTNPEEALKKLEDIEKTRIEERFTLRHKSTGKWARNQQIRAKYDKESRQNLAKQLTISRELTQKSTADGNSSGEDDDVEQAPLVIDNNPWVNGVKPEKYLKINKTNLSTAVPNIVTNEEVEDDQRAVIFEAFEDDDIVDEFNQDKSKEIDKDKPKSVNLALPGWGSWGGTGVKVNKRKKRRFTVKVPTKIPRRDDNREFLIINESAQNKEKEHMVSDVPFPFKTVKDFEANMRAPISNSFVPETAYRKLIKPAVTTKMGTIIEPMSKDLLLNKNG